MKIKVISFVLVLLSLSIMGSGQGGATPKVIDIVAKRYTYEPDEITIKKGEPVTLRIHSTDVTHGLEVKEFNLKKDVSKNKDSDLSFTPDHSGTFDGKCSHYCGNGHGSMKMTIHVTD